MVLSRAWRCLIDLYRAAGVQVVVLGQLREHALEYQVYDTWTNVRAFDGSRASSSGPSAMCGCSIGRAGRNIGIPPRASLMRARMTCTMFVRGQPFVLRATRAAQQQLEMNDPFIFQVKFRFSADATISPGTLVPFARCALKDGGDSPCT